VNKVIVRLFGSLRFSTTSVLLILLTFGTAFSQAQSKQNDVLQGTVVSAVDKKPLKGASVRVEVEDIKRLKIQFIQHTRSSAKK
jgi:hypothetical protein